MAIVAQPPKFLSGVAPLLPRQLVMVSYSDSGAPDLWEEKLITGICGETRYFTAIAADDAHFVHDGATVKDVVAVGPRGGLPVDVRCSG